MDTCEGLKEYLAAYADGELEGDLRERVRVHLSGCERCRAECAGLKRVAEIYRQAVPPEVRSEDWERVSAALDAAMLDTTTPIGNLRTRPRKTRVLRWELFPAAALVAAAVLVALLLRLPTATPPGAQTAAQVVSVETGPDFEAMVRVPVDPDDFLVIDVFRVE